MADIEKMDLESKDLIDDRLEKLQDLLPEAFSESGIDFDKLRLLLGDEVDEGSERYAFTWPGKTDAIRQSQTVSTATLRPCPEKSRSRDGKDGSFDSDNIYIEGDNLEVLKLLQRGYHGKVKMIYIDPPYNTGHDFVYKDKFGDTIENYKQQASLTGQSNADTSGRFHSDWCSMMYPRLKLARELLSDDGVIFISIDDNENRNLRILCDEVFGEPNFVAQLIWERAFSPKNDAKFVSNSHDYVLVYAKSIEHFTIGRLPRTETANARYTNPDNDPRGPWMSDNMTVKTYSESTDYPITTPSGRVVEPPAGRCWRLSRNAFRERLQDNRIWFGADGNGVPRIKRFLCEVDGRGMAPTSLLFYKEVGHSQEGAKELVSLFDGKSYFDGPKPTRLLQRLMTLANLSNNDTVLDFFSGSASMAHSVFKQEIERGTGYHFVLVQLPEGTDPKREAYKDGYATLCDIGEERIRRAGDKIKSDLDESNRQLMLGEEPKQLPDIGFRVFTLDDSGIEKPQPGKLMHEVVKPNRTELDIVFEMMLKWGLELTLPVEKSDAADYPVWSVACDELVCCMSPGLTIEALEAIADMEPKRVLILDSILNDTLKLNAVQIFKHASERIGTDIELRTV
ncbi:adenine-specific DNA-methyltransferase [Mobiluncus mulieris]|uniref:Putative methyltransferase n=1 Tax=Mobiluncus mulieris TaxID=2052 RepID=A0A8G2HX00_9ACTO|nr:site-specific DNA-methyltransferase [Mobiluncus mulieris]MBB5846432.1 adenine-specific DNA-methyltransferase [Mobiluncus mulieris]MCV0012346.1 site-specific DNA-methyltransferase [Mobiluncus mulieris]STO17088.1 putative methyltransferase [Mobiluncus mulieris]